MPSELFSKWLEPGSSSGTAIDYFVEKKGSQQVGLGLLKPLIADHFVGESTIMQLGGYKKSAAVLKNSLPTNKRTQSGDMGELLATEYVNSQTEYTVPIKKLRWKSDRQMPMHGNDVLGINYATNPRRILKCECKSRTSSATMPSPKPVTASIGSTDDRTLQQWPSSPNACSKKTRMTRPKCGASFKPRTLCLPRT